MEIEPPFPPEATVVIRRVFQDHWFVAEAVLEEYRVCYRAWRVESFTPNGTPIEISGEPWIEGYVKIDGCCEWRFPETDNGCYLHFCDGPQIVQLGQMLTDLYYWTDEIHPDFDRDG